MLMFRFLLDILQDRLTARAHGITGVEDVEEDVGGINDLVEFIPDTAGLAFGEHGVPDLGARGMVALAAERLGFHGGRVGV